MSIEEDRDRYLRAMHAVQSGIAMKMNHDPADTTPKHLRTGINSGFVAQHALSTLLIAKGVITEEEYYKAQADSAEQEQKMYEAELSELLGTTITLG